MIPSDDFEKERGLAKPQVFQEIAPILRSISSMMISKALVILLSAAILVSTADAVKVFYEDEEGKLVTVGVTEKKASYLCQTNIRGPIECLESVQHDNNRSIDPAAKEQETAPSDQEGDTPLEALEEPVVVEINNDVASTATPVEDVGTPGAIRQPKQVVGGVLVGITLLACAGSVGLVYFFMVYKNKRKERRMMRYVEWSNDEASWRTTTTPGLESQPAPKTALENSRKENELSTRPPWMKNWEPEGGLFDI